MDLRSFQMLPRNDVVTALDQAVRRYPLVVLTAPIGYGKSTVVQRLINSLEDYSCFYFSVSQGAHNAMYLWDCVWERFKEQGSQIADTMRNMGFPLDSVQWERTVAFGKNYLVDKPTLLVLDDYHFVQAPEMDLFIEHLIRGKIPNLSILLSSRTRPNIPLEELRIKGLATLFEKDLLEFSEEETFEYFKINGLEDPTLAKKAWTFSEGWASALWFSLRNYLTNDTLVPLNAIDNILAHTVYSAYKDSEKKLLLELSILESFSSKQAVFVANDQKVLSGLKTLYDTNAFLSYDYKSDTYRLHGIFRSYLNSILEEQKLKLAAPLRRAGDQLVLDSGTPPARRASDVLYVDRPALFRRAAEWFVKQGEKVQAIRFFSKAGRNEDLQRILDIFAVSSNGNFVMFDPEGVLEIIESMPWSVKCACPIGFLGFTYHYMSRVNLEKGVELLAQARDHFLSHEGISPEIKRRIQGEIELIRGIEDFNDLFAMRDRHQSAHTLLTGTSDISHSQLVWTFGSPHVSFLYLRDSGTYLKLIELVEGNLQYYQDLTSGCSAGAQDLFRGEYFLETGNFNKVKYYLDRANYRASAGQQLSSKIAVNFTLGGLPW